MDIIRKMAGLVKRQGKVEAGEKSYWLPEAITVTVNAVHSEQQAAEASAFLTASRSNPFACYPDENTVEPLIRITEWQLNDLRSHCKTVRNMLRNLHTDNPAEAEKLAKARRSMIFISQTLDENIGPECKQNRAVHFPEAA